MKRTLIVYIVGSGRRYSYAYDLNGRTFELSADSVDELNKLETWYFSNTLMSMDDYNAALLSAQEDTAA